MVSDASWRKVYDILNDLRGWLLFTKLDLGLKPKIPRRSGKKVIVNNGLLRKWDFTQGCQMRPGETYFLVRTEKRLFFCAQKLSSMVETLLADVFKKKIGWYRGEK